MMYPEIRALMGSKVDASMETSVDAYGKHSYAPRAGSPYACYPVDAVNQSWSMEGREEMVSLVLYCDAEDLQSTDQFVYRGRPYRCINVETWRIQDDSILGQVVYLQ